VLLALPWKNWHRVCPLFYKVNIQLLSKSTRSCQWQHITDQHRVYSQSGWNEFDDYSLADITRNAAAESEAERGRCVLFSTDTEDERRTDEEKEGRERFQSLQVKGKHCTHPLMRRRRDKEASCTQVHVILGRRFQKEERAERSVAQMDQVAAVSVLAPRS